MIRRYTVALMQMDTQNDKGKNLRRHVPGLTRGGGQKGRKLICFPEVMNLIGKNIGEGGGREEIPGTRPSGSARKRRNTASIFTGQYHAGTSGEKRSAIRVC